MPCLSEPRRATSRCPRALTLDLAGNAVAVNGLSGSGTVDNSGRGRHITVGNNNATSTFSGVLQNSGGNLSLAKTGTGVLTLLGSNTYTGATTVLAGTLQIGNGGTGESIGTSSAINYNAAALTFNQGDNTTYSGPINGTGTFSKQGLDSHPGRHMTATGATLVTGGTLALPGTNTCTGLQANGATIVVSGSVNVANSYFYIGNGGTNNGITNTTGGQLIINSGATLNVTGSLGDNFVVGRDSGSGTVVQNGGLFNYDPSNTAFYVCATNNVNTTAYYYMNGGTLNLNSKTLVVGNGVGAAAVGTMTQSDG